MPYTKPSWRLWPQLQWLSRLLCVVGIHHWMYSKTIAAPILCRICMKRTRHYLKYRKLFDP